MKSTLVNPSKSPNLHCDLVFFSAAHVIVWTILPLFTHLSYPFDVIEGISWGRVLQWGYPKHPPLAFWVFGLIPRFADWKPWPAYVFSQLAVVICFYFVWKLAREFFDVRRAFLCVLLLECVAYYNGLSTAFNPNVLQLPLWAAMAFFFWRAVDRRTVMPWLAFGIASGLALLTKYYAGALLVPLALLLVVAKEGRACLRKPGPWLALIVMSAVFLPHVFWLMRNEWFPLHYAISRTESQAPWLTRHFGYSGEFVGVQLLILVPLALCFLPIIWENENDAGSAAVDAGEKEEGIIAARSELPVRPEGFSSLFLSYITWGPFLLTVGLSVLLGWKLVDAWGTPLWSVLPLWIFARFHTDVSPDALRRFNQAWLLIVVFLIFVFGAEHRVTRRGYFPGPELAEVITNDWHSRYNQPLQFVIGDTSSTTAVEVFSPDHPRSNVFGDPRRSVGIDDVECRRVGAMLVWQHDAKMMQGIPYSWDGLFYGSFPVSSIRFIAENGQSVDIGWGVLPPKPK